ncbi:MAG TPA: ABC transporter permease [Euzebyales bacterium]|nr:ABC transporter permease [Euzebyales bacterium]
MSLTADPLPTPRDGEGWVPPAPAPRPPLQRFRDLLGRRWLTVYSGLVLLYLFVPIIVTVLFSFNDNLGRFNFTWRAFTLDNWRDACGVPGLCPAMVESLKVAGLATLGATLLGTLVAFALVRYRFRGRGPTNLALFLPMATPEIVMGTSLLALFLNVGMQRGFRTIVIGHIMFNISFVVVTVKARLQGQDANLEEAAMDLYADEWTTFRKVTLPLAMPGIIAGALLAFALSFDDFVITNFVSGNTITFPMFVWGAAQRGIPPQVNVMATLMFVVALSAALIGLLAQRRR